MSIFLKNAPLVEAIAEIRWQPILITNINNFQEANKKIYELFDNFVDKIAEKGFYQSEKLIPINVPILPQQPIIRIKKNKEKTYAYQIGDGIFSIHAIKPYKTWEEFQSNIKTGLITLKNVLNQISLNIEFNFIRLHYINVFKLEIIKNHDDFLEKLLNFSIKMPKAVEKYSENNAKILNADISVNLNLNKSTMHISAGYDLTKNIIMHLMIYSNSIDKNIEDILALIEKYHNIINDTFFEINEPFINLFK